MLLRVHKTLLVQRRAAVSYPSTFGVDIHLLLNTVRMHCPESAATVFWMEEQAADQHGRNSGNGLHAVIGRSLSESCRSL
jgi:hypothetical protein